MQPVIRMLNRSEIERIDKASREILNDVGMIVDMPDALEIFHNAGAEVDSGKKLVKLPGKVIDEALEACAPCVQLFGRGGREPLSVGGFNTYYGTTGFPTNLLDHETGTYRPCLYSDLIDAIRLGDVIDPPDYILPNLGATDVSAEHVDLFEFKAAITNTGKHIQAQAQNKENLKKIIAMAAYVAGGKDHLRREPFFSLLVTLTSPLCLRPDSTDLIIAGAKEGLPLFIESGPMSGATSPATLASTLITANAELLSSIVLAKQVNSDIPVIYASWARIMDMKRGNVSVGCPEFGMLRVGTTQMAKFYNLPSGGGGTLTDSKWIDGQMGAELMSTALLPTLSGTNLIQGMGLLGSMNGASFEAMVISSEIINYIKRIKEGIRVDEDTTGTDIFREVGPLGNFLTTSHTFNHFKKEMWSPNGFDRSPIVVGKNETSSAFKALTKEKIAKSLSIHRPPDLPAECNQKLDDIIYGRTVADATI